jgi:hypothetical protein
MCGPDGSVTIVDMVSGGARHNELERLRDPSHTRALADEELGDLLAATGLVPARFARREQTMSVEAWLKQSATPEPDHHRIHRTLAAEADGGDASGLRAARTASGVLTITQHLDTRRQLVAAGRVEFRLRAVASALLSKPQTPGLDE